MLFSLLVFLSILFVFSLADGYSDSFYLRFTSPRQQSLILGVSRAAQDLEPSVFNQIFAKGNKTNKFYNYSFSLGHSPYGYVYFTSIKKKIDPDVKDGVYILDVEPWTISSRTTNPNDSSKFEELNFALAKTNFVNIKPNIQYLFSCFDDPYIFILWYKFKHFATYLHNDGWLEVTVPMDSIAIKTRMDRKIKDYTTNYIPNFKFSQTRFHYFLETINFLKTHGKVYLVRLPVHPRILSLENELMPQFDSLIDNVSLKLNVVYFNFKDSSTNYQYTDGTHMYKASVGKLSEEIAREILESQNQK